MKRLLLAAVAIVAIGLGYGLAQTVVQQQLLGSEAWQVGQGAAGPGFYTTTKAMRGGQTYQLTNTGTTVTETVSPTVDLVLITGAITTLNLSLPFPSFDQQTVRIACPGGVVSTLNISPLGLSGQNLIQGSSFSTCDPTKALSAYAEFTFTSSTPTAVPPGQAGVWFRTR